MQSLVGQIHCCKLKHPLLFLLYPKSQFPTIILGMDVSHGSPGQSDIPSIAAVVSSREWPLISKYRASVHSQSPKLEMIDSLFKPQGTEDDGLIRELLVDFYTSSGKRKPGQIIIFSRLMAESEELAQSLKEIVDNQNVSFFDAADTAGYKIHPDNLHNVFLKKDSYFAFIELHIEQGPILEKEGIPIGIVTAIAAPASIKICNAVPIAKIMNMPIGVQEGTYLRVLTLPSICTDGKLLRAKFLVDLLNYNENESKDNIPEVIREILNLLRD